MPYIFGAQDAGSGGGSVGARKNNKGWAGMGRIVKAIVVLVLLGLVGLAGYAYLGDMSPWQAQVTQPVMLDVD